MASLKKTDLKAMDLATAQKRLLELRTELMKLNAQVAVGTNIESPGRIKATKRNIARLLALVNSLKKNKSVDVKKKEEKKK